MKAFSEHSRGRQCAFMSLAALHFNRSNSIDLWTQTNIDDILCQGDRMYLHALTTKMVPDANSLSIEQLPEVATSQNNVEYSLMHLIYRFSQAKSGAPACLFVLAIGLVKIKGFGTVRLLVFPEIA